MSPTPNLFEKACVFIHVTTRKSLVNNLKRRNQMKKFLLAAVTVTILATQVQARDMRQMPQPMPSRPVATRPVQPPKMAVPVRPGQPVRAPVKVVQPVRVMPAPQRTVVYNSYSYPAPYYGYRDYGYHQPVHYTSHSNDIGVGTALAAVGILGAVALIAAVAR